MASMPDLIFTVLFFFMIVTHMRNETVKVKLQVPQGTEVTKSSNKFSTINIYIGRNNYGDTQIQVNGRVCSIEQVGALVQNFKANLSEEGLLTIDEKPANIDKIRRLLKEFIVSTGPSHIIELKTDRKCDYDTYFHLQNEIVRSYREIRDAASKQLFGKPYSECTAEQREQIAEKYPQRVQEVY